VPRLICDEPTFGHALSLRFSTSDKGPVFRPVSVAVRLSGQAQSFGYEIPISSLLPLPTSYRAVRHFERLTAIQPNRIRHPDKKSVTTCPSH